MKFKNKNQLKISQKIIFVILSVLLSSSIYYSDVKAYFADDVKKRKLYDRTVELMLNGTHRSKEILQTGDYNLMIGYPIYDDSTTLPAESDRLNCKINELQKTNQIYEISESRDGSPLTENGFKTKIHSYWSDGYEKCYYICAKKNPIDTVTINVTAEIPKCSSNEWLTVGSLVDFGNTGNWQLHVDKIFTYSQSNNPIIVIEVGEKKDQVIDNIAYGSIGCRPGYCNDEQQKKVEEIKAEINLLEPPLAAQIDQYLGGPPTFFNKTTNSKGTCEKTAVSSIEQGNKFECKITDFKDQNDIYITWNDKYLKGKTLNLPNVGITPSPKIYGDLGTQSGTAGIENNKQLTITIKDERESTIAKTFNHSTTINYNGNQTCKYEDSKIISKTPGEIGFPYSNIEGKDGTNTKINSIEKITYIFVSNDLEKDTQIIDKDNQIIKDIISGKQNEIKISTIIAQDGTVTTTVESTGGYSSPPVDPNSGGGSGTPTTEIGGFKWHTYFEKPVEVTAQAPFFNEEGKKYKSLGDYLTDFYLFALWLIAAISVIMIIVGGYTIITSSGNPEGVTKGRGMITSALIALGLLVLAFVVLRIISPQTLSGTLPDAGTGLQDAQENALKPGSGSSSNPETTTNVEITDDGHENTHANEDPVEGIIEHNIGHNDIFDVSA